MTSRSARSAPHDQVLTLWILVSENRVTGDTVSPGVEPLLGFITRSQYKWSVAPLPAGGGGWAAQGDGALGGGGRGTVRGNGSGGQRATRHAP
jgi:hypothetical protein